MQIFFFLVPIELSCASLSFSSFSKKSHKSLNCFAQESSFFFDLHLIFASFFLAACFQSKRDPRSLCECASTMPNGANLSNMKTCFWIFSVAEANEVKKGKCEIYTCTMHTCNMRPDDLPNMWIPSFSLSFSLSIRVLFKLYLLPQLDDMRHAITFNLYINI